MITPMTRLLGVFSYSQPTQGRFKAFPQKNDAFIRQTVRFSGMASIQDLAHPTNSPFELEHLEQSDRHYYRILDIKNPSQPTQIASVAFQKTALHQYIVTPMVSKGGFALRITSRLHPNKQFIVTPGGSLRLGDDDFSATVGGSAASASRDTMAENLRSLKNTVAFTRPAPTGVNPAQHKVLILASGGGTRLKELTGEIPKPLFPLANGKSMVLNLVEQLLGDGFAPENIAITIPPNQHAAFAADLKDTDVTRFFVQPQANGTADAINQFATHPDHQDWLNNGKAVVVLGADHIDNLNMAHLLAAHQNNQAQFTTGTYKMPKKDIMGTYGLVKTQGGQVQSGLIERFVEKPQVGSAEEAWVDPNGDAAGTFKMVMDPALLKRIAAYCAATPEGKEKDLSSGVIEPFIAEGGKGYNFVFDPADGYAWTDAGKVSELVDKNYNLILKGRVSAAMAKAADEHLSHGGVYFHNPQWKEKYGSASGPVFVIPHPFTQSKPISTQINAPNAIIGWAWATIRRIWATIRR
ncbi:MAG: sugar phosphate nucleotidyltransferase [Vampirovibrionales bacterium]